jgi:hypothetical protein
VSFFLTLMETKEAQAKFFGQLSLADEQGYVENVRFSQKVEDDFVSQWIPTLTLLHKSAWEAAPDFTARLSVAGEYFSQHPELNNFGDNIRLNTTYLYPYSPRLNFTVSESLERQGASRTGGMQGSGGGGLGGQGGLGGLNGISGGGGGSGFAMPGGSACRRTISLSRESGFGSTNNGLVIEGQRLENQSGVGADFRYSPNLTLRGRYCWEYLDFIDTGGNEFAHSMGVEGNYQLGERHTVHARYTLSMIRSRDGQRNFVHDFDIGDNFLNNHEIHLTPTLIFSFSTGIALLTKSTGGGQDSHDGKFRVENKLDAHLTKIWEAAAATLGVRRGLTSSLGVAGPSFTTSFFSHVQFRLTRRLAGVLGAEYDSFDTGDETFDTLQTFLSFQYQVTSWLSAYLNYSYRMLDGGSGTTNSTSLSPGVTSGNSVFLGFSFTMDIWPDIGFAREMRGSFSNPTFVP